MTAETQISATRVAVDSTAVLHKLPLTSNADRQRALVVIFSGIFSAAVSALLVWSFVPFMELLFDPDAIAKNSFLSGVSRAFGSPDPYALFLIVGAGCVVLIFGVFIAQLVQVRAISHFSAGMTHELSKRLLSAYLQQSYEFFLDRHRSELTANILSETEAVVSQFYRPALQLATALLTTVAVIAVLAVVDPAVMIFLGGGILVVYSAVYLIVRHRIRRLGEQRRAANKKRFREATDGLQSIKDVKVLGLEEPYLARFSASSQEMRAATVNSQLFSSVPGFSLRAILLSGGVLFILLYVRQDAFLEGRALSEIAPALGALVVAAQRLLPELQRILESLLRLQYGVAAVENIRNDLSRLAPALPAHEGARIRLLHDLTFKDVSYAYPGAERPGLSNIDLTIRAGEKVGIVGRSGAGKTTLGDVALGLLAPVQGEMFIDGQAITQERCPAWQLSVGFVPQDIFLKDASVAENIALGLSQDKIDMERVRKSARVAHIEEFVTQSLPQGFDTMIGERGVRLSGGQRQRLAIARALYRDADLIVFDEATSALDSRTEQEVMDALRDLSEGKTILIVAHRLTTLSLCDKIIVLENGKVAGTGTRSELEKNCQAFCDLLSSQA